MSLSIPCHLRSLSEAYHVTDQFPDHPILSGRCFYPRPNPDRCTKHKDPHKNAIMKDELWVMKFKLIVFDARQLYYHLCTNALLAVYAKFPGMSLNDFL